MNFFAQARRGGRSTLFDHIGVMPRDLEMGVGGTPAANAPPWTRAAPRGFQLFSCAGRPAPPPFFDPAPRMR